MKQMITERIKCVKSLAFVLMITSVTVFGDGFLDDDLSYGFESGSTTQVYVYGLRNLSASHITIPANVAYEYYDYNDRDDDDNPKRKSRICTVERIANNAFNNKTSLKSVTIKTGLTHIGDRAFSGCSELTSVNIPDSVTIIGDNAFYCCSNLICELKLPNGLERIGKYAFYYCSGLTGELKLPSGLTHIENGVFAHCSGLTGSLKIPNGLTSIGDDAFWWCKGLTGELKLPMGLNSIGTWAFCGCSGLTSVTIPDSVTTIGIRSFCSCNGITHVTIPGNVNSMGTEAFSECDGLTSVTIDNGITSIGRYAFYNCTNLTSVAFPNSLLSIEDHAFFGCSKLTSELKLPSGLISIGACAFYNCGNLSGELKLPNGLMSIGEYAFYNCGNLSGELKLPSGLENIEAWTFARCGGLTNVIMDINVKNIGVNAFAGCSGLVGTLFVPDSVVSIGSNAFSGLYGLTGIFFNGAPPIFIKDSFYNNVGSCSGFYSSSYKSEWADAIGEDGYWHGLEMRLDAYINVVPVEMNWRNGELTIGWTPHANFDTDVMPATSYSIYYSDNTNTYDTANVVVEGLSGLLRSYKDSGYLSRLDGIKPVCYFVVGSDGSVGVCQTRNRHGIFVGLNEWDDPDLKPIGGDKNANDFCDLALRRGGFPEGNIYKLTNHDAKADAVDAAFDDVAAKAKPGDICLFYFSTHGGTESDGATILCLYDFDYTDSELAEKIKAVDVDYRGVATIGIVSACHSGGLYNTSDKWNEWYVKNNLAQCSPNVAWLSSSDVTNTAYGVFDEFLLKYGWEKGWAGSGDTISFNDLATYTKSQYDALFSGTVYKGEKKSKTAQIEDPGGLLSSIIAGSRGTHDTSVRRPATPGGVSVETGALINQLSVSWNAVADAVEYRLFFKLASEDGYRILSKGLDANDSPAIWPFKTLGISELGSSDLPLQIKVKAINGAGISEASTCELTQLARITFDGNGGEVGNWRGAEAFEVSTGYYVVFGDVSVGSKLLSLPYVGTYSTSGYRFNGWFDESGVEANVNTVVSQSTVYYARWEPSVPEPAFNINENGSLIGIDYDGATEITIPSTVTSIANGAFGYNSELEHVIIPASVTYIHAYAFDNCSALTSITVAEGNPSYKSINGLLVTKDGKTLVQGVNGDVKIPLGVTTIGDSAFYGCGGLTSVEIPESVTIIDEYAFAGCFSMTSVSIPANVECIGDDAFSDCTALDYVEFVGIQEAIDMDVTKAFYGTPWLVSLLPTPENDDYSAAVLLSGDSGRVTGTNIGASSETIESGLGLGNATIWWKWQAPGSYTVEFDTLGSGFDTILGVYVESEDGLSEIAYSDDCDESNEYESLATFNATEGSIYHIVVSGYESKMGTVVLNWSPNTDTPIPAVTQDSEIATALSGSADTNLIVNILNVEHYNAYRGWATALNANSVSALAVKRSPNAWLSFALGADTLIWEELASGDVKIESFTPTQTDGKFEFSVSVKDVNIGGGSVSETILKENLKKVLGVEGAKSLSSGAFSSDNIDITFDTPVEGKARFTVSPPADAGNSFFMRVKVK